MDEQKESCPTRTLLLTVWQSAAEAYSKAVAELSRQIGVLSKQDYERLKEIAEGSRHRSQEAQAKLDVHIHEHGCNGNGQAAA